VDVLARYSELYLDFDDEFHSGGPLTDVNQVGILGNRPITLAAYHGDMEAIEALIEGGADVNYAATLLNPSPSETLQSAGSWSRASGSLFPSRRAFSSPDLMQEFRHEVFSRRVQQFGWVCCADHIAHRRELTFKRQCRIDAQSSGRDDQPAHLL